METIEINSANAAQYAKDLGRIHAKAYSSDHFSAMFNPEKLAEYNLLLLQNSDISLVAVRDNTVLGFLISGTAVSRGVREFTRENRAYLVGVLLSHPKFMLAKIAGKLNSIASKQAPSKASYRLLSVAVDPSTQSKGVGAALLNALEQRLKIRNVQQYGLSVRKEKP